MAKEPSFENALAFAQDLIRIPSLSGEEGEVVARIRKEMDALGYDEVTIDEVGNVIGVVSGGVRRHQFCLTATWTWSPRATRASGSTHRSPGA